MANQKEQVINFWNNFLVDSGCYSDITREAEDVVNKIFESVPDSLSLFSDEAKNCMVRNYTARMKLLYNNPIISEIHEVTKKYNAEHVMYSFDENKELLIKAADEARKNTDGYSRKYFRDKYSPIFCEYEDNIRKNFTDSMNEFLSRLSSSLDEISKKLLNGKTIKQVRHISGDSSDTHRHGRIVIRVQTDAGNFFYKPHDCGLDSFYYELISKYFSEYTCAAKVLEGDGYAFVSELSYDEVNNIKDIERFYYNFGALTAIFHGLGSTDMHEENIIACGVKPSTADIETIVRAKTVNKKLSRGFLFEDFNHVVLQTCVFPVRFHNGPMVGALYTTDEKNHNAPMYKGKRFNIEGHEEEFIAGFREGYAKILEYRNEIKLMFSNRKNICVRFIMRNTAYYSYMLGCLYVSDAMKSREEQNKVLEKLNIPYTFYKSEKGKESFVNYERSSLLQGDIPYYCIYSSGHDVCGENTSDVLYKDFFSQSPEQSMCEYLDILSDEELRFEEDFIRNIFISVPSDCEDYEKNLVKIPSSQIKIENCLDICRKIFDDIQKNQLHLTNGLVTWRSTASTFGSVKHSETMPTLQGGIGQYCAKFSKINKSASDIVNECLKLISKQIDIFEQEEEDLTLSAFFSVNAGLFSGLGGLFLFLNYIAEEKFDGAEDLINRLLKLTKEKLEYTGDNLGVCYGASGLILALYELRNKCFSQNLIDELINKFACYISEKTLPESITGDEGLDGIAAAFAVSYACTGDKKFYEQAINIFEKLREDYSEFLQGWPEHDKPKWAAKKSAWSGGVLYNSLIASELITDSEIINEVLHLAIESTLKEENLFARDSIFNGNALSVLALIKASRQLSNSLYLVKAGQMLSGMLEKYNTYGTFNVTPNGINSFFDPSFFFGTSGIGYAVLSYMDEIDKISN